MLDHVFTDAISALRDAFEGAFLERQAFDEHFQVDVLLGDLSWETSYGLPGEGQPPRVVAHITFDWPSWSQTAYRSWCVDEVLERQPAIEMEIVFRVQRLIAQPEPSVVQPAMPDTSPLIGDERLERAGLTVEIGHFDRIDGDAEYAIEVTYEGLYELAEETLADGVQYVARRALRQPRRVDLGNARQARRPQARLPPGRRRQPLTVQVRIIRDNRTIGAWSRAGSNAWARTPSDSRARPTRGT